MKQNLFIASLFLLVIFSVTLIQSGCSESAEMSNEEMVSRGEYLVTVGLCNDCHSPKLFTPQGPVTDTTRLLSGHPQWATLPEFDSSMIQPGKWYLSNSHLTAWIGPWGISYTANLTPDDATGIGRWTDEIFIKALRTGKHMGSGRPILPPMPWNYIGMYTDQDLKAMFSYLKSIPAINNQVPEPKPPVQFAQK